MRFRDEVQKERDFMQAIANLKGRLGRPWTSQEVADEAGLHRLNHRIKRWEEAGRLISVRRTGIGADCYELTRAGDKYLLRKGIAARATA